MRVALFVVLFMFVAASSLPQSRVRRAGRETGRSTFVSFPMQQQAHSHAVTGSGSTENENMESAYPVTSFWSDFGASLFGVNEADMSLTETTAMPSGAITTHHYEQRIRGVRVIAGSVNVMEGAHHGVLSAQGHPLRTADVAEVSEVPSIDVPHALAKAMHYLQEKFGVVYKTQVEDVEAVWVRPGLAKDGTGKDAKLAYKLTTTTTIDANLFTECFAAEGGLGDKMYKPSDAEKVMMDKYGVEYPKTSEEVHAKRVTCTAQVLKRSHPPSHFSKAVQNAVLAEDNKGVIHVPERNLVQRFTTTKAPTTRRVSVYVDAHSGTVVAHDDQDINKFTGFNGKKLAKRAPKEHLDLVALKQDKVITTTVKDNKFGNLNGWELGMSPLKTFWGANVEMIKPKHHKQMVGKNAIDFVDFHVVVYDCEGDDVDCDPEEYTTVLFDSDVDAFPTNDDEINLVIQSTYDTKVMYEVISGGTWKSYMKEVAEWRIYLHMDLLNAFWDGTRTVFGTGMVDDDVVAHEWSHAYTEYTSAYAYYYQSGALNEHMSDAFGEAVDQLNTAAGQTFDGLNDPDTSDPEDGMEQRSDSTLQCNEAENVLEYDGSANDDLVDVPKTDDGVKWMIGEGITRLYHGETIAALRDMWYPWCFATPLAVPDPNLSNEMFMSCGDEDYGGVHTNSNIMNYLYAHLVDGGDVYPVPEDMFSANPTPANTVAAWTLDKAVPFWWALQTGAMYGAEAAMFEDWAAAATDLCTNMVGVPMFAPSMDPSSTATVTLTTADCTALQTMINSTRIASDPYSYCVADVRPTQTQWVTGNLCNMVKGMNDASPYGVSSSLASLSLAGYECDTDSTPVVDPCINPGSWSGMPTCYDYQGSHDLQAGSLVEAINLQGVGFNAPVPSEIATPGFYWGNFLWSSFYFVAREANITGGLDSSLYNILLGQAVISENPLLTGAIPDASADQNDFTYLELSYNALTSLPTTAYGSKLNEVNFEGNLLSGSVPKGFTESTGIQMLSLGENNLSGPLDDLLAMESLAYIDVSSNQFSGSLPAAISESLAIVAVIDNALTGSVPTEWCDRTWDSTTFGITAVVIQGNPDLSFPGCLCSSVDIFEFSSAQECIAPGCNACPLSIEGDPVTVTGTDDFDDDDFDDNTDDFDDDYIFPACLRCSDTLFEVHSCGAFGQESDKTCEFAGSTYCCASNDDACCDANDGAIVGLTFGLLGGLALIGAGIMYACGCGRGRAPKAKREGRNSITESSEETVNPMGQQTNAKA